MVVVGRYIGWSAGAGFIPMPLVDIAAVTAVQLRMIGKLADVYGVPFSRSRGKAMLSALLGAVVPSTLARGAVGGVVWALPVVGPLLGIVTTPALDGASTYAVGKIFIEHFESGGTFLDFNPDEWRGAYARYQAEGRDLAGSSSGSGSTATTGTSKAKPAGA
jgi:uncharacterized protein (DUF697 family)